MDNNPISPLQDQNNQNQNLNNVQPTTAFDQEATYQSIEASPQQQPQQHAAEHPQSVQNQAFQPQQAQTAQSSPLHTPQASEQGLNTHRAGINTYNQVERNTVQQPAAYAANNIGVPAAHKKKKKLALIGGLIGGALFVMAGTAAAYVGVILPNKPENVVARSVANLVTGEKSGADMSIRLQINGKGSNLGSSFSATMPMSYDYSGDKLLIKVGMKDINIKVDQFSNIGGIDLSELNLGSIDAEMNMIFTQDNNRGYIRVEGLDSAKPAIESVLDLRGLSQSEMEKTMDIVDEAMSIMGEKWISIEGEESLDFEELNRGLACISEENLSSLSNDIKEVYLDNRFLLIQEDLGKDTIDGEELNHYKIKFSSSAAETFDAEMTKRAEGDTELNDCLDAASSVTEEADNITNDVTGDTEIEDLEDYIFDVWIDGDKNIRVMNFEIDESEASGSLGIKMNFRDAVDIEVPSDTKTIEDIQTELSLLDAELEENSNSDLGVNDLAQPSLEQSRRNTQRQVHAEQLIAAAEKYASNNDGLYPSSEIELLALESTYWDADDSKDPSTGLPYELEFTTNGAYSEGSMSFSSSATCNKQFGYIEADPAGGQGNIAVEVYQEDFEFYCTDNQ